MEENDELDVDCGHRVAFREFGSVLGLKCYDEYTSQDYWNYWIEKLLSAWRRVGLVPIPKKRPAAELIGQPKVRKNLTPITEVMFCAAIIPGGKWSGWFACLDWRR
jgi:hypothetical protein